MRIGIDARFYGSLGKGLGRYTEKLIEHLEELDQENEYVIFLRRENFDEYLPKNQRFKKIVAQYAWYGWAEQSLFVWMLYRSDLDLVHFPHFNVPLLYRKTFVVTIHDLILVHYPTLRNTTRPQWVYTLKFLAYRLVIASAVKRAAHIITVSQFTENDIVTQYPVARGKITVTYEAADAFCQWNAPRNEEAFLRTTGLLRAVSGAQNLRVSRDIIQPYFLYVGNAYPHKNLPILFAVAKAFPEFLLVFVGKEDYFYSRLRRQVEQIKVSNIIFAGFVTDAELSSLYRWAQAYLFPSLYEGFGLPPLEALARGTPVVASNRGSLPEILGDAALYFEPTDERALIATLHQLLDQPDLRSALQKRGYARGARFHFRDMAEATLHIYEKVNTHKS